MLGAAGGVALILTDGASLPVPKTVSPLGQTVLMGWLPLPVLIALVLAIAMSYLLHGTRFGLRTFAIGSNFEAARRNGVDTGTHLFLVYALCGAMAGMAGVLIMARFGVGSPTAGGSAALLNSVTAPIIGGVSLFGGRGTIAGAVIGSVIVTQTLTGLTLVGVGPYWQSLVIGLIIVGAVAVQRSSLGGPFQALNAAIARIIGKRSDSRTNDEQAPTGSNLSVDSE
jgi:ribose transport system permease protein